MKLFLSSYRAGNHTAELLKLLDGINKVAFISNAKDYYPAETRRQKMAENFEYWHSIGIQPTEVDLRPYFNKTGAEELFVEFECVWMMGGNVFLLRRALAYSGLDTFIANKVKNGQMIYGGESAGAMLAGPTLKFSEEDYDEDSPNFIPDGYKSEILWDGLGFTDFIPVPHYKAVDYGAIIDKWIERLDQAGLPHKQITDEQAILINGTSAEVLK